MRDSLDAEKCVSDAFGDTINTGVRRMTLFLQCYIDPGILDSTVTGGYTIKAWKVSEVNHRVKISCSFAKKVLLTLFLNMRGPIPEDYQTRGQTLNKATDSCIIKDKLKPAARNKGRGLLTKSVLLASMQLLQ